MRRVLPYLGLALGVLLALPVLAKEGDTFRPFVSYARYYDSNLLRLDYGEPIFESGAWNTNPQRSDQYSVLSAGVNVDWQPGRQRVIASATKNQVRYSHYERYDNDGSDYQLKWNWRLGNHWSGQVGATESVSQSSFETVGLVNNQITRDNRFANADWQFHPRWSVGLGTAAVTATNSTYPQTLADYEDQSISATLGYATPKGSRLQGQYRRVDGGYPNRANGTFDRLYTQTEYNLLGDWSLSGKLIARGRIGYVQRGNDSLSQRDFSRLAGRLLADYSPTGKTILNGTIYREIENSDDIDATYQLNSGVSLGAAWLATSKITLRANTSYENRSFEGDVSDQDTLSGSLSLRYAPVSMATIDVGLQAGRRDSSISAEDYTFRSVFMSVRADF